MIRVLIVDDNAAYRTSLRGILSREADFEVVGEAADGLEGMRQARRLNPDVVLMDFAMPVMDGLAAAIAIRNTNPQIKTYIVTAYADTLHAGKIMEAGFTLFDKGLPARAILTAMRLEVRPEEEKELRPGA